MAPQERSLAEFVAALAEALSARMPDGYRFELDAELGMMRFHRDGDGGRPAAAQLHNYWRRYALAGDRGKEMARIVDSLVDLVVSGSQRILLPPEPRFLYPQISLPASDPRELATPWAASPETLRVSLMLDMPDRDYFVAVDRGMVEAWHGSLEELWELAWANLRRDRSPAAEVQAGLVYAYRSERLSYLNAAHVLLPEALEEVAGLCDSDRLLVGVPCRDLALACHPSAAAAVAPYVLQQHRVLNHALSPRLFVWNDGQWEGA